MASKSNSESFDTGRVCILPPEYADTIALANNAGPDLSSLPPVGFSVPLQASSVFVQASRKWTRSFILESYRRHLNRKMYRIYRR
jgi:hypothetical protein